MEIGSITGIRKLTQAAAKSIEGIEHSDLVEQMLKNISFCEKSGIPKSLNEIHLFREEVLNKTLGLENVLKTAEKDSVEYTNATSKYNLLQNLEADLEKYKSSDRDVCSLRRQEANLLCIDTKSINASVEKERAKVAEQVRKEAETQNKITVETIDSKLMTIPYHNNVVAKGDEAEAIGRWLAQGGELLKAKSEKCAIGDTFNFFSPSTNQIITYRKAANGELELVKSWKPEGNVTMKCGPFNVTGETLVTKPSHISYRKPIVDSSMSIENLENTNAMKIAGNEYKPTFRINPETKKTEVQLYGDATCWHEINDNEAMICYGENNFGIIQKDSLKGIYGKDMPEVSDGTLDADKILNSGIYVKLPDNTIYASQEEVANSSYAFIPSVDGLPYAPKLKGYISGEDYSKLNTVA